MSNLRVLAPNGGMWRLQGAGGLRSAPPAGAARLPRPRDHRAIRPAWAARRHAAMERPRAGRPSYGLGQHPRQPPAGVGGHCGEGAEQGSGETPRLRHSQERPTPAGVTQPSPRSAVDSLQAVTQTSGLDAATWSVTISGRSGRIVSTTSRSPIQVVLAAESGEERRIASPPHVPSQGADGGPR
jgi:hypothetical protein